MAFKPFSPAALPGGMLVSELKSPSGNWNESLIRETFLMDDADCILSIPCSSTVRRDSLIWHFEKSGSFTVKSAYHFGVSLLEQSVASGSGLGLSESWWKYLWRLKIPSKVKMFIWKACKGWLPVKVKLVQKKMLVDQWCPFCCNKA